MYVLSIAGFDPTGGAGILADTKVFSLLGVKGGGVPTTLTLQNTSIFQNWTPVDPNYLKTSLELVFSDLPVKGIKIGMIGTPENLEIISYFLKKYRTSLSCVILDPVLKATLEHPLFSSSEFVKLLKKLIPLIDVITPNIYEAEVLTQKRIRNREDVLGCAEALLRFGCRCVVIKGYTTRNRVYDLFFTQKKVFFSGKKRLDAEFHGTGCVFSSAMLCFLIKEFSYFISFKKAKNWLYLYLKKGLKEGIGGKIWLFL